MRVFLLSDLHIDYDVNRCWVSQLSSADYREDILVLAGDVTDDLPALETCLRRLSAIFLKVLFVPGNHDLWVWRDRSCNSVQKFRQVCAVAGVCGISMEPFHCGPLTIVPLLGWYDFSFAAPEPRLLESWGDLRACVWPDAVELSDVSRYFCSKNEANLALTNRMLISFSHFLPRIDLMPAYIPHRWRYLYPALGSVLLEEQIRTLKPDLHLYGHSHVNRRVTLEGVRYVNNAFGYPWEDSITGKSLLCVHEQ